MMAAPSVSVLSPARVKALLRGPLRERVVVIDVRDSDFVGGHIKGAKNIASHVFNDDNIVDQLLSLHCDGKDTVVVHCYLSQQRGPFCAQRLASRLAARGGALPQPEVCVMSGGWKRFSRELEEADLELVEDLVLQ